MHSNYTKRHAELAGEADALKARLAQIAIDLGHLGAMVRQFDPDYNLGSVRPKRPRGPDVASRFIAERGRGGQDRRLVEQITKRIVSTLRHQGLKGTVQSQPRPGWVLLWEMAR